MTKNNGRNRPNHKIPTKSQSFDPNAPLWLWGTHAVMAALSNPKRKVLRVCATRNAAQRLAESGIEDFDIEDTQPREIDEILPREAVHQGLAALVAPLPDTDIEDILSESRIIVFDQLTDPHNIGAIFRSASAFGFSSAILQTKNVPPLTGTAAKSAAGALESVKEVRVVNISRSIERLKEAGFHTVGLDGTGHVLLKEAVSGTEKLAIVIGAEGSGLRPGVAKSCDQIAKIPISGDMESLNASNAAAIAFYEASVS